jgi:hypothetical protein
MDGNPEYGKEREWSIDGGEEGKCGKRIMTPWTSAWMRTRYDEGNNTYGR